MSGPLNFPAWGQWGRRKGAIVKQPEGRGPNGRKLCRWCGGEVPFRASSWCGEKCVAEYKVVWTWEAVRKYVIRRDKVCQRCSAPHPGWKESPVPYEVWPRYDGERVLACFLEAWAWEVDHIHRIADGGNDDPANLRLLCHDCHVAVGYEQRAAKKARAA